MKLKTGVKVPESLMNSEVIDESGNEVALKEIVNAEKPLLLIFIRHFGCFGCALQMNAIAPRIEELNKLGVQLVLIGNGAPNYIVGFKNRFNLHHKTVKIVTDPSVEIYKKAGLTYSLLITYGPITWIERIKSLAQGITNENQGVNGQMGGSLLINPEGNVEYYYKNKSVGNFAEPNNLFERIYLMIGKLNKDKI